MNVILFTTLQYLISIECLDELSEAGCEEVVKKCLRTCGGCEEEENDDVTTKLTTVKTTVFPTTTRSTINSTLLPGTGRDVRTVKKMIELCELIIRPKMV